MSCLYLYNSKDLKLTVINIYTCNNNVHKADSTGDAMRYTQKYVKRDYFNIPFVIQDRSKGQK